MTINNYTKEQEDVFIEQILKIINSNKHNYYSEKYPGLTFDSNWEVKGDQFFRINESGNEEMFCPYRNPDWSDEHYQWMCGKYKAKHQCMLNNGVIILRKNELNNLNSVFSLKE